MAGSDRCATLQHSGCPQTSLNTLEKLAPWAGRFPPAKPLARVIRGLTVFRGSRCCAASARYGRLHNRRSAWQVPDMKNEHSSANAKAMSIGVGVGLAIGAVIGLATDNIGLWLPVGVALGAGLGAAMARRGRK